MTPDNATMSALRIESGLPLRRLACAGCGTAFECGSGGSGGGCWCMDEAIRMPMPDVAQEDCLCLSCLRAVAAVGLGRIGA
jgi:hypothetical protein